MTSLPDPQDDEEDLAPRTSHVALRAELLPDGRCMACARVSPGTCTEHAPPANDDPATCERCWSITVMLGTDTPCGAHAPATVAAPPPDVPRDEPAPDDEGDAGPLDVAALHRTMAALAPYARLAAAGGLRALPVAGRDGQGGGGDPQAGADRMSANGDGGRARAVWTRLGTIRQPHRGALVWLADRGDARPSPDDVALLYARECGPIALRDAVERAGVALGKASRAYSKDGPQRGQVLTVVGAKARDRLTQAQHLEAAAVASLRAWGTAALARAVDAWRR